MTFQRLRGEDDGERAAAATEVFGEGATAEHAYDLLTVNVPPGSWVQALTTARDVLGCTYFDWLSAVDEPGEGYVVAAHLVAVGTPVRRLLVRTRVPHDSPSLPTATGVYAGAAWHERETHEMFGVDFPGHPYLAPLLLPEGFEGHPLRKEFVLAARVAKAWPGAKEPGESEHGGPKRRQMLPPGVPDPNEWGPMKGKLAPEPARARPARAARPGAAPRADRPRRTRSVGEGSVSQAAAASPPEKTTPSPAAGAAGLPGSETAATPSEHASRRPDRDTDAPWQQPRRDQPGAPRRKQPGKGGPAGEPGPGVPHEESGRDVPERDVRGGDEAGREVPEREQPGGAQGDAAGRDRPGPNGSGSADPGPNEGEDT